jgi:hypothetical protein
VPDLLWQMGWVARPRVAHCAEPAFEVYSQIVPHLVGEEA